MLTRTTSTGCDSRVRRRNAFESKVPLRCSWALFCWHGMITHDMGKNEFSYNLVELQRPVAPLYVADLIELPISHPVQQGG